EAAAICEHGAGHAGAEHVGGGDGHASVVGGEDGGHGHQFRGGALGVGQVFLSDLFADRDDDALPAHHGAQAQSQSNGYLDPDGDELGGFVHMAFVVDQSGVFVGGEGGVVVFLHQAYGFAGHVHVVTDVGLVLGRNGLELL